MDEDGVAFRNGSAGTWGERFVRRRETGERLHDFASSQYVCGEKCGKLKTFEDKNLLVYAYNDISI